MNNEITIKMKTQALKYVEQGFSIIPVGNDKKPLVTWQKYQVEKADKEQIENWWSQFPNANIGIVTGKISNLVVVDVDVKNKKEMDFTLDIPVWLEKHNDTYQVKTASGGRHYYFYYPKEFTGEYINNSASLIYPKVDVRGEGGYVVAPPSTVEFEVQDGVIKGEYAETNSGNVSDLPKELYDLIIKAKQQEKNIENKIDWKKFLEKENGEGVRNVSASKLAGKVLQQLSPEFWELSGWATMKEWNEQNNNPKMSENELREVWESIKSKELKKNNEAENTDGPKKSQASLLVEQIESDTNIFLFHDETKSAYIKVNVDGHQELWKARSKQFKSWLAKVFWEKNNKAANSDAINTALNIVDGKCNFDGPEVKLANRATWVNDVLWYDLSDEKWRAVKITNQGWELVDLPPILFRRYGHQQAQVVPETKGDIKDILKYVNIQDEKQKILFLVYVVACFIPDFPHPVLNIYGAQGSAKSSLSKVVRKLVDPSILEVTEFPKNQAELVQKLSHHWLIFFDNVSHIPDFISDILCRVVTGSGFSKRELYTDDEDIIYTLKRCVGINGINLTSEKADLLERSILLELERMPKEERRQEKELFEEFELNKPKILAGIFNVLVKTLENKPSVKLTSMPRMADFAVWGSAIALAIGYTQEDFLEAYNENIDAQNKEVLLESFIASALLTFMEDKSEWQGTSSSLLSELKKIATLQGVNVDKEKGFPKAANTLSRQLNLIKPNLLEGGISFSRGEGNNQRLIFLQKVGKNITNTEVVTAENDTYDNLHNILDFNQTVDENITDDTNDNF